ncbi:pyrroline-5-carboxylate reductase [Thermodesulfobacteriota bacterium]
MSTKQIGFIGAGNMANALIKGLINSDSYHADQITASDNDDKKLALLSDLYRIDPFKANKDLVQNSDIIILSVKPQVIRTVLEEIRDVVRDDHLIISIAAGIPVRMILSIIGRDVPVIRVMPNTPALIQKGISALAPAEMATEGNIVSAQEIFNSVGNTVVVNEDMMDAVTALSGSGPGYVFKIMESFVEAGEKQGFDNKTALQLTIQTFLGAASLASQSELSLTKLREMVASPGGTTAAGLSAMEDMGLDSVIETTVDAACKRSVELGKNY